MADPQPPSSVADGILRWPSVPELHALRFLDLELEEDWRLSWPTLLCRTVMTH